MLSISYIGEQIAGRRKAMGLSQMELARKARISRATLDALENSRTGELGYSKITNILAALGLELKLQEASQHRPTLEELLNEDTHDHGMDRPR